MRIRTVRALLSGSSSPGLLRGHTCRIHAQVFAWNRASMKVLERAGYVREGVLRRSVVKEGEVIDSVLYARVLEEPLDA